MVTYPNHAQNGTSSIPSGSISKLTVFSKAAIILSMKNKRHNKLLLGYLAVLISSVVLFILPLTNSLDRQLMDQQFIFFKTYAPKPVPQDIVIIGIDEDTVNAYYEPLGLWHPHIANIANGLAKVETKGVMLDFILHARSYNKILNENFDDILALGLRNLRLSTNLVVVRGVNDDEEYRVILPEFLSVIREENTGIALIDKDSNGIVREFVKTRISPKGEFHTFVGNMADKLNLPAKDGYINYTLGDAFEYIPMHLVSEWINSGNVSKLEQQFSQKLVLLGTVMSTSDRHRVPLPIASWEPYSNSVPGILIHAQALRSIISDSMISPLKSWFSILLVLVATLFWWLGSRLKTISATLLGWSALLVIVSTVLLSHAYWLPVVAALLSAVIAALMRIAFDSYEVWQERRLLKSSFSGYVSPSVLNNIISGGMQQGLGGENRKICVIFVDIRDFTTRSENQTPQDVIKLLNRHFSEMTDAIHAHGGTVDKFMGDGLMAFFGAPNELKNAPRSAFAACKEMLERLQTLNQSLTLEGLEEIRISIGMHYGYAVIGHVGSSTRHEYTAIGDTVNIAARLEYVSKEADYPIVCTQEIKDDLDETLIDLGRKNIKGRSSLIVYGWAPPSD
ncbi:MAG: adenylate cyclase [Arenicella sp.]